MDERRRDGDRIVRLETVVERIETDIMSLSSTYREMAAQQQSMFIESIKSQAQLQAAVQELTRVIQEQKPRVDDLEVHVHTVRSETTKIYDLEKKVSNHEQWKWKITGIVMALTVVLNVIGWIFK